MSRHIVRAYVRKCPQCQQKQVRTHKAALVPIMSKKLYERIVFDLIDFSHKPSRGYHYILHAIDHYSKFHWAWALRGKTAHEVAYCLGLLLSEVGAIRFPQCDQCNGTRPDTYVEVYTREVS